MAPGIPPRRPWTLMVYMAGDNGKVFNTAAGPLTLMDAMADVGYEDLFAMSAHGTTDACAVTCLLDTPEGSYLVEVRKGRGLRDSLVEPLGTVNMGDYQVLRDFVVRSMSEYPADHTMLVIWNHGTGWLDVDVYERVRSTASFAQRTHPIFRSTPRSMLGSSNARPIAFDDSSKDFLDTHDLRLAFRQAAEATGRRLDIIGMDACLMAMIEGARELVPFADYFVASQEVEPMAGWPYAPILGTLNKAPAIAPAALAERIVAEYVRSYSDRTRADDQTVTQSAVILRNTSRTEALCAALVEAILANQTPLMRGLVQRARDKTFVFRDRNYRDLGDFAAKLAVDARWSAYRDVAETAAALSTHLLARGAEAPVLRLGYLNRYQATTGLSVFLPATAPFGRKRAILDIYRKLAFPRATQWDKLVEWLL